MNQPERCAWLIEKLLAEKPSEYAGVKIPAAPEERKRLLRALMNVRPPAPPPRNSCGSRTNICRRRRASKAW